MKTSSHNDDADSRREHIIDSDQIPSKHSDTSSLVSTESVTFWTGTEGWVLGQGLGCKNLKKLILERPRERPKT